MTTAHTVWLPTSCGPVPQQPSRKKPVIGSVPHSSSGPPRTFSANRPARLMAPSCRIGSGVCERQAERGVVVRRSAGQSLCILAVGVATRRDPDPKSASTATLPLTETMRPRPWRSWATRSPTTNISSGGIASRAALKGLAGRRRLGADGGIPPLSPSLSPYADSDLPKSLRRPEPPPG